MKVILLQDIKGTGKKGDVCEVSAGFAQNFLLRTGKAKIADNAALNEHQNKKVAEDFHYAQSKKEAEELAKKLNTITLNYAVKSGDNGKIFGSITSAELAEQLKKMGYDISKKQIVLPNPIKFAGRYEIEVKLFVGVSAKLVVVIEQSK